MTFSEEIESVRRFTGLKTFTGQIVIGLHVLFVGEIRGGSGAAQWDWLNWERSPMSLRDKVTWSALTIKAVALTDRAERELVLSQAEKAAESNPLR